MEVTNLEELFINATENDGKIAVLEDTILKNKIKVSDSEVSPYVDLLLETWEDQVATSAPKAQFVLKLAELGAKDSSLFRNVLHTAIKATLPPYMNKPGFFRALGLRDNDLGMRDIFLRFQVLLNLKIGVLVYQLDSNTWGQVTGMDDFVGTVVVTAMLGRDGSHNVPLDTILSSTLIFENKPDLQKIVVPKRGSKMTSSQMRAILNQRVLVHMREKDLKSIALHTAVPVFVSGEGFQEWWEKEDDASVGGGATVKPAGRQPADARSVHELHVLLGKADFPEDYQFSDEDVEKFEAFFTRLKIKPAVKDQVQLIEALNIIAQHASEEMQAKMFKPLVGKCPFWPEDPEKITLNDLEAWGKLKIAQLGQFVKITAMLMSSDYLAELATHLPIRCLNEVCSVLSDEQIQEAILSTHMSSCDILLWVWKNRKKHSETLQSIIRMANVTIALAPMDRPKEWEKAQKDLKTLVMENEEFQKKMIENAGDNVETIVFSMRRSRVFDAGEQQSLLVKLSRNSEAIKQILETTGIGKTVGKNIESSDSNMETIQPVITSTASFKRVKEELDNIINVLIPANREDIKTARAHGDFKENSEYDAAKERRNFLSNRRDELERGFMTIQPFDFNTVKIKDTIEVGSQVTLTYDDNSEEVFYILGAWDGDPDKNYISYKTPFGAGLLNKKVGEKVTLSDGKNATIKAVSNLPKELLAELTA